MICPECKCEINDNINKCENCEFDIAMYREAYERIYAKKLEQLNNSNNERDNSQIAYKTVTHYEGVHKPRCPYCNSENLTRITSLDKVVNIAMFGLLGNKRKYQWHCNNCKTNW